MVLQGITILLHNLVREILTNEPPNTEPQRLPVEFQFTFRIRKRFVETLADGHHHS